MIKKKRIFTYPDITYQLLNFKMKITIFTGRSSRHKFLIKILRQHELHVISEEKNSYSYLKSTSFKKNNVEKNYFNKVKNSEKKIFGKLRLRKTDFKKILKLKYQYINKTKFSKFKSFLKSDIYIVFGSSIIKGELLKFLIKKKCINIHMGISPYYRGSNCNFWAIIDKKYNFVGSTIHYLSPNVDQGQILYHAITEPVANPFDFSMAAVKSAIISIANNIKNNQIFDFKPNKQNLKKQIRLSKNSDIDSSAIKKYPNKIMFKNYNKNLLINPFVLKKRNIYAKNFKI